MQLTFACPGCRTEYDLPWSMSGKRVHCRRCDADFVVPAPFEPRPPRSSEAIPVIDAPESASPEPEPSPPRPKPAPQPAPAPPPRPGYKGGPPSVQAIEKHRAGSAPGTVRIEAPRESALPPAQPAHAPAPARRSKRRASQDAYPWAMAVEAGPSSASPDHDPPVEKRTRGEPTVDPIRAPLRAPIVAPWKTWLATATSTRPAWLGVAGSARPPWLIPAIASGGVALLLILNIGLYLAFAGGLESDRGSTDPVPPVSPLVVADVATTPVADITTPPIAADPAPLPPHPDNLAPAPNRRRRPGQPMPATVALAVEAPEEAERLMSTADVVAMYEPSVALIQGKKGSGTGFLARAGIVATNAHVIDGEKVADLEVRFPSAVESSQGPLTARILYKDTERDLALLAVSTDLPPLRVAKGYKFRKGEDVTVIGNPGVGGQSLLENAISRGILSSVTKLDTHTFYQLGIAINPGNSGGPVFDPRGRVIGVVTLKTAGREGLAFAIPADDLLTALDAAPTPTPSEPRATDR